MLVDIFLEAVGNVLENRKQKYASMLGIIIGVIVVLLVLILGSTMQRYFLLKFNEKSYQFTLQLQKAELINNELVADYLNFLNGKVKLIIDEEYGKAKVLSTQREISLHIANSVAFSSDTIEVCDGEGISASDEGKKVCVVSEDLYKNIFHTDNFQRQSISLYLEESKSVEFTVIGLSMSKEDDEYTIYIPNGYLVLDEEVKNDDEEVFLVFVADASFSKEVLKQKTKEFFETKGLYDYFSIQLEEGDEITDMLLTILSIFFVIISVICFMLGQLNMLNTMMLSVKKRIKDIGIRRAIGAKQGHIFLYIFFESIVLSLLGIAIGVLIAIGIVVASVLVVIIVTQSNEIIGCLTVPYKITVFYFCVIFTTSCLIGCIPAIVAAKRTVYDALIRGE